jgi:hypothetical protein
MKMNDLYNNQNEVIDTETHEDLSFMSSVSVSKQELECVDEKMMTVHLNNEAYLNQKSVLTKLDFTTAKFKELNNEDSFCVTTEKNQFLNNAYNDYEETFKANEIKNKDDLKMPYFSIENIRSSLQEKQHCDSCLQKDSFENIFNRKEFLFIYLEISHFIFFERDLFSVIYPDTNLILIIQVNDNQKYQEKLYFTPDGNNNTYIPLKTKLDLTDINNKSKSCRIMIPIIKKENDLIKVCLSFFTYSNRKLLLICNDDIFIQIKKEDEMKKFKMYKNFNLKYHWKKVGNLVFDFAYKSQEMNNYEKEKNTILKKFFNCEVIATFEEIPSLMFNYYHVQKKPTKDSNE